METQLPSTKGAEPPLFGPYLLWPNGWMDQHTTPLGTKVGLDPSNIVLYGDPAPLPKKRGQSPQFSAHVYCD